ncbi:Phospholipid scramblase 2 [Orchesella cincta]|uniref:Phospholipid scramblase n=1 Tax=Orchesella cincta TaxID=48709 RepID=A0A1D2N403_ORCCI|nr:Phospholipid scramblase 2 [Orchesella cincta]
MTTKDLSTPSKILGATHSSDNVAPHRTSVASTSTSVFLRTGFGPPELEPLQSTRMIIIRRSPDDKRLSPEDRQNHFKYDLSNEDGTRMFKALEQSNRLGRLLFQNRRPCKIFIVNSHREIMLKLDKPCTCCLCCWNGFCCNKVLVYSGIDRFLGEIRQNLCSVVKTGFTAWNGAGVKVLYVTGPISCAACCDAQFKVFLTDGTCIGTIRKGMVQQTETDVHHSKDKNFGASFLEDIDVVIKCLILATSFLIDLMYYKLGPTHTRASVDSADITNEPKTDIPLVTSDIDLTADIG